MGSLEYNRTANESLRIEFNMDMDAESLVPDEICAETLAALALRYSIGSLLIFIIFLSISGNLLVCVAIFTDRRLRKLGNLFLASLAVADLFLASIVMTFAVANDMMGYWAFGEKFCETWIAFDVLCCTASIVNLCAISLDRFLHIKDPLCYERWMSKKVVCVAIGSIWLLSALVSFLPISLGWHRPPPDLSSVEVLPTLLATTTASSHEIADDHHLLPQCALDLTPVYAVVSSTISFYLPCLIMVGLYTRLYLYARKHVKNIKSITKPLHVGPRTLGDNSHHHQSRQHLKDHKAAITLGIIMGVFLFCWVPFFCINVIASYCKTCIPLSVFKVLTWLGYFNSAMNPIIYSIFNTEFREAFRRILVSYVRDECCERRHLTNKRSRSNTDPAAAGLQLTPVLIRQDDKHKPRSSSADQLPVKDRIELSLHHSDGKISAI